MKKSVLIIAFQPLFCLKAQGHGIMVIITKLGLLPPNMEEVNTFLIPTLLPQDIRAAGSIMFGMKKERRKNETLIKSRVRIQAKTELKQKRNRSINSPEMNQKQEIK